MRFIHTAQLTDCELNLISMKVAQNWEQIEIKIKNSNRIPSDSVEVEKEIDELKEEEKNK